MTQRKLTTSNLSEFFPHINRFTIGFDPLFEQLEKRFDTTIPNYPPYNMITIDENTIRIEVAISGFKKGDVVVSEHNGQLSINGIKSSDDEKEYQHKGISNRSFNLTWALAEYSHISEAVIADGMLAVTIVQEIPTAATVTPFEITYE